MILVNDHRDYRERDCWLSVHNHITVIMITLTARVAQIGGLTLAAVGTVVLSAPQPRQSAPQFPFQGLRQVLPEAHKKELDC